MSNQQLAVVPVNGTALEVYGEREQVRELADRLMALHPQAEEIGAAGMRAAAQLALMVGASPLPATNEVHVWKDNKGKICVQLGINYWRRKADEWGGVLWKIRPRQMMDDERKMYGVSQGQLASICQGVRAEDMIQYRQMGFTVADIWEMCAGVGIGVAGQNEYAKSGRPPIWSAMKRAETDLYRQLFPVQWANESQKQHSVKTDRIMLRQEGDATMSYVVPVDMEAEAQRPSILPDSYSVADANRDLFGYVEDDDPDTIIIDAEDGEVEDIENAAEVEGVTEEDTAEDDQARPLDDELAISEATGGEFLPLVAQFLNYDNGAAAFKALKGLGFAAVPKADNQQAADMRLQMYRKLKEAQPA